MGTIMVCLAAAMVGVDVGWRRLPDGGMEYIIQIEPQTLEALRAGEAIQSYVPAEAGDIRSYRIEVGSKKKLTNVFLFAQIATEKLKPALRSFQGKPWDE